MSGTSRAAGLAMALVVLATAPRFGLAQPAPVPDDLSARADTAERLMREALAVVGGTRRQPGGTPARAPVTEAAGHPRDVLDADREALVGPELSPLVTTLGSLESKRLATDPRWARVLVKQLASHGVGPGAMATASFSGSFPGLNLAVMAACRALGVGLVAISSVTSSSWGASEPGFTWPEIEVRVVRAGVLPAASVAISLGGGRDAARDLADEGRELARRIQATTARDLGALALRTETLEEAIASRLEVYRRALGGRPADVYINVGGNHASLGGATAELRHEEGWLDALPAGATPAASVTNAHVALGVPVLSLLNVKALSRAWNLHAAVPSSR